MVHTWSTASCLISQADKKIKTTSSLPTPLLLSEVFSLASRQETNNKPNPCNPLLSTSSKSDAKTKESSIMQRFSLLSLRDGLMRREHQVIQQLSRGNPLDCTLPPDNEWKCPLASSKLTSLLGVVLWWFPTCLHLLASKCSFLLLWNYSRTSTSRYAVCAKNLNWVPPASPACSNHMVALLIRLWIYYETDLIGFVSCILSGCKWYSTHRGSFSGKRFLYSAVLVLAVRS